MKIISAKCNWCEEKIDAQDDESFWEKFFGEGWISVQDSPDEEDGMDFCSVDCLLSHYDGED